MTNSQVRLLSSAIAMLAGGVIANTTSQCKYCYHPAKFGYLYL